MGGAVPKIDLPDLLVTIGELEVQRRILTRRVQQLEAELAEARQQQEED